MTDATTSTAQVTAAPSGGPGDRDGFVARSSERWDELDQLLKQRTRSANDQLRVGQLSRSTAADLAFAREYYPHDPMLGRLTDLALRANGVVNSVSRTGFSIREFYRRVYWQRIVERKCLLALATALMIIPGVVLFVWCLREPERALTMLDGQLGRASWADQGYSAGEQSAVAAEIFTNNIRVSILAFATGITFGIGTAWLLIFNGALLGVVAGVATTQGHGSVAFALIVAHGVLELSVIIVAAVAGMRMGWALVDPGLLRRSEALRREALAAVEIVLGTIPFFVLAGLVEGFFTPAGFGPVWAGVVGIGLGGTYWVVAFGLGRRRRSEARRDDGWPFRTVVEA